MAKEKKPYIMASGKPNKYGAKVATHGHRCLANGSVIASETPINTKKSK